MAPPKLVCIIKPFCADAVVEKLEAIDGVGEILVSEVRGYGRQKGHLDLYRGSEYDLTFLPKVQLEIYLDDDDEEKIEEIIDRIIQAARTGRIGDGKIFRIPTA